MVVHARWRLSSGRIRRPPTTTSCLADSARPVPVVLRGLTDLFLEVIAVAARRPRGAETARAGVPLIVWRAVPL